MKKIMLFVGLMLVLAACGSQGVTAPVKNTPSPEPVPFDKDLIAAIEEAAPGATLYLAPATYFVSGPVVIKKAITIVGSGRDDTQIVFNETVKPDGTVPAAVHVYSPGSLTLKQVTVSYAGKDPGSVIRAVDADLYLSACRVDGAVSTAEAMNSAIILRGASGGRIEDCAISGDALSVGVYVTGVGKAVITKSQFSGLEVAIATGIDSQADLMISGNEISSVGEDAQGVFFKGSPNVILTGNSITGSTHAAAITEASSVQASQNVISGCSKIGFLVSSSASVILEKNNITGCPTVGIGILDSAAPIVKNNTLRLDQKDPATGANAGIGIYVSKQSGGQVIDNTIEGYQLGIAAVDDSKPALEGNTLTNDDIGINIDGNSTAAARKNTLTGCRVGIAVETQAKPLLEENTIEASEKSDPSAGDTAGIVFTQKTGGQANRNTIKGCGIGIDLANDSAPDLKENTISGGKNGIRYSGNAAGVAAANEISNNDEDGIHVDDQASPLLQGNTITSNAGNGIDVYAMSQPVIEDNEISSCKVGILVSDTSNPVIKENNLHDNQSKDMQTGSSAG